MYTYKATITEVYDGDTVTALVDLGFRLNLEVKIRLSGINTPEIRGVERPEGLIARDRLRELVLGKQVTLVTEKDRQEKFGRWLGELFFPDDDQSVNQKLLQEGLAKKYT